MPWSIVGDPGNEADPQTGFGAVEESYRMGTYNVTAQEYCFFLNAVAASDPYGLYNTNMASDSIVACIQRSETSGHYHYSLIEEPGIENFPITYVSWFSAARFCNWLQNGQRSGDEDAETTETGAYTLNGTTNGPMISAEENATYFLPSENQWYKAAYYKSGGTNAGYWKYPFQSNTQATSIQEEVFAPTAYGTANMGGDVFQWTSSSDFIGTAIIRGDDWALENEKEHSSKFRTNAPTTTQSAGIGFRVAAPLICSTTAPQNLEAGSRADLLNSCKKLAAYSAAPSLPVAASINDSLQSNILLAAPADIIGTITEGLQRAWAVVRSWFSSGYEVVPEIPLAVA